MFGFLKKIPSILKTVVNVMSNPKITMGVELAALVIPGGQILMLKRVLNKVKIAEVALGPGGGLNKFNRVFDELIKDPMIRDNKELKDLIEKAVMITNGTVMALDTEGNKIS